MRTILFAIGLTLAATTAQAQMRSYYGPDGSYQGSSTTYGGQTTFYGSGGQYRGSAQTHGNQTTYFGSDGSYQGSSTRQQPLTPSFRQFAPFGR